jgi:hypothetical protein
MVMRREVAIEPPDGDGAVLYVEHYVDADGNPADEAAALHYVGAYLDADGETVRKAWGKVTRPTPAAT